MPNMSYCRFENTSNDMQDCLGVLAEAAESGMSFDQFISKLSSDYERRAVTKMFSLLEDMAMVVEQLHENEGLSEEELEELEEV